MHRLLTTIGADVKQTSGQAKPNAKFLSIENEYMNPMIGCIIAEKYETLANLKQYTISEFLYLFECVIVYNINKAKAIEALKK